MENVRHRDCIVDSLKKTKFSSPTPRSVRPSGSEEVCTLRCPRPELANVTYLASAPAGTDAADAAAMSRLQRLGSPRQQRRPAVHGANWSSRERA